MILHERERERRNQNKSFTLVELLIVMGVLAVVVVTILVSLNPSEAGKKSRDVKRIKDLNTLQSVVLSAQSDNLSLGAPKTVYISLPSSSTTCTDLNLPTLPSGYVYHCSSQDNLTKTDGTGWIPIDTRSGSSPLNTLPKDQRNKDKERLYYSYITGDAPSDFKLTAKMEVGDSTTGSIYQTGGETSSSSIPDTVSQSQDPLMQGLVGWWKFDEGSGTTARDSSDNGNNGTLNNFSFSGQSNWTTGKVSGALSFDGTDDWVLLPQILNTDLSKPFSFSAWAKSNVCCGWRTIIGTNGSYAEIALSAGDVAAYGQNGGGWFIPSDQIVTSNWYLVVGTYDGSSARLYLNGDLKGTQSHSPFSSAYNHGSSMIGRFSADSATESMNGVIDDVRIYNRALSGDEIKALYDATK